LVKTNVKGDEHRDGAESTEGDNRMRQRERERERERERARGERERNETHESPHESQRSSDGTATPNSRR